MASVCDPLGTVTVFAIGQLVVSYQVAALSCALGAWPGMPSWISYTVPGVSCTRLPRHSLLRASNHIGRPGRQFVSPLARNCTVQPAAPGLAGGVQYRPIEWKVL